MRTLSIPVACYFLASFMVIPSQPGVEVVASKSLTVQPNGPRPGAFLAQRNRKQRLSHPYKRIVFTGLSVIDHNLIACAHRACE